MPCRVPIRAGLGGAARESFVKNTLDLPGTEHETMPHSIADLMPYRIGEPPAKSEDLCR